MKLLLSLLVIYFIILSSNCNKINTKSMADMEKYLNQQDHDTVIKLAMGCRCFIRYMSMSDEIILNLSDKSWLIRIAKMNKPEAIRFIISSVWKYQRLNTINDIRSFMVLFQHEIIEVLNLLNKSD